MVDDAVDAPRDAVAVLDGRVVLGRPLGPHQSERDARLAAAAVAADGDGDGDGRTVCEGGVSVVGSVLGVGGCR